MHEGAQEEDTEKQTLLIATQHQGLNGGGVPKKRNPQGHLKEKPP